MSRLALLLTLATLPTAALAQPAITCATFAENRGIPAPPDSLTDQAALQALTRAMLPINFDLELMAEMPGAEAMPQPEIAASQGCSLREMAMLTANFDAIDKAQVPADPAALAGTWMSDDIFLSVAGAVVPGQEVLVIGDAVATSDPDALPGTVPDAGSLPVSQFWYHGIIPSKGSVWTAEGEYYGLIVSGHLTPKAEGGYSDNGIVPLLDYAGITIIPERVEDLFLKSRLNLFQRDVTLETAGDTLVVTYDAPIPIQRVWTERQRSYHRVAPGAPDEALRIVQAAGLPFMPYFGCLALRISAQDPELLAAIAPMTTAELDVMLREYHQFENDKTAFMALSRSGGADEATKKEFLGKMERMNDVSAQAQAVGAAIQAADLCMKPPYFSPM